MALKRVWIPSPNYSSRGGSSVRILVIHTSEGAMSYQSLGSYFSSSSAQVSSHVGIDSTPNEVGEYVRPPDKSWTCAAFNPASMNAELCAFASYSAADWNARPVLLENAAKWIREECDRWGLPCVKLTAAQAQSNGRGVCGHDDLGAAGGGHWDPGPSFPWSDVIAMAKGDLAPPKPPTEDEIVSITTGTNSAGALHVFVEAQDGSVWYTWQKKGETAWQGGKTGVSVAKLQPFAPAPK